MRAAVAAFLMLLGLAPQPSHAAGPAVLDLRVDFDCLGCGWGRVSVTGTCTGECFGTNCAGCFLTGTGESYTSQGSCQMRGEMYGDVTVARASGPFTLTWNSGRWTMRAIDMTTAYGVVVVGGPCLGGEGSAAFTGLLGGPA